MIENNFSVKFQKNFNVFSEKFLAKF